MSNEPAPAGWHISDAMVEVAALAIWAVEYDADEYPLANASNGEQALMRLQARAALEAAAALVSPATMHAALSAEPILLDHQRAALTVGFGAILSHEDVFNIGWRSALGNARRAIEAASPPPVAMSDDTAHIPEGYSAPLSTRTSREIIGEKAREFAAPPVAPAGWHISEAVVEAALEAQSSAWFVNLPTGIAWDWAMSDDRRQKSIAAMRAALSAAAALVPPAPADVAEPKERS